MRLGARLLLSLAGIAAFATALALVFQDRTLARDLEAAAAARLERSARAADQLIETHLASLVERYRAIASAPQFRANLEVDDPPTLAHYAAELERLQGAARVLFLDARGRTVAAAGDPEFDEIARSAIRTRLVVRDERLYAIAPIALDAEGQKLGKLIVAEPIAASTLEGWARLCGAEITFAASEGSPADLLSRLVRELDGVELRVESGLHAEHLAMLRARTNLLSGGAIALVAALIASYFLARAIVEPIQRIRRVAEQIGRGDFSARLHSERSDELGSVSGAIDEMAVYLDAHARALERSNAELLAARDAAQAASRAKGHFLTNMSHEIRTPMTAILGYIDLLCDNDCDAPQRVEWSSVIRRNGEHLLELINSILDVSKIEAGKLTSQRRLCVLEELVRDVVVSLEPQAEAKGLDLACELAPACPDEIETDPTQLRQVLMNLLANAVKFTERGSVRLDVAPEPAVSGRLRLRFDVRDTGIGLRASDVEAIFEPFAQADASLTRRYGGTGLGLTISRHLSHALGGEIEVSSEPGRGSCFSLFIDAGPVRTEAASHASVPASAPARASDGERLHGRVLVAEDSADNQRLIRALLRRSGLEVEVVENGALACERALAAQGAGRPFELILMDMQMPLLDGYEATARLRAAGYDGPIVALTAHAMEGDEQKCLDAGCDGYATKPIDRGVLMRTLARYCARAADATLEAS